ncbi:MAG TPA: VCBS repeat-containing protein, partial [Gemmataceae bacterium]|nr:VCBS repeat-containing protein [Gemmataceae bacterium]
MVHSRLRRAVCWLTGGLLVAAFAIFAACRWGNVGATAEPVEEAAAPPIFQVIEPGDSGVKHLFRVGEEAGHFGILEALGGGAAVFDFDGDGLMDIFLTGGGYYTGEKYRTIRGQPCRLYKNLGGWKFRDVTAEAGLECADFYTHGCAVADYDCDGWPDLLVTGYGRLALFHNEPVDPRDSTKGRKFVDVTQQAGLLREHFWSTSAAWGDLDGDGYPDLYVCQYVNWSLDNNIHCKDGKAEKRDLCGPVQFQARPHALYRNLGNGRFLDVSNEAGLCVPRQPKDYDRLTHVSEATKERLRHADQQKDYGKGLGVLLIDVNGDGKPDIYVANDSTDNFLYLNRSQPGKIRLEELGQVLAVAQDDRGKPNGSMGLDAADYDRTGRPSIWVTNWENDLHALYQNMPNAKGDLGFRYATRRAGMGVIGNRNVGWGTAFIDLENGGWEDVVIVHGHTHRYPDSGDRYQFPVIFRNGGVPVERGQVQFVERTREGGLYFQGKHNARGMAVGDLDNDGRLDLIVSHLTEPAALLRNVASRDAHWLGIQLET